MFSVKWTVMVSFVPWIYLSGTRMDTTGSPDELMMSSTLGNF